MDRRRLLPLVACVVALAGCGDDAYYATRALPTSASDSYAAPARWARSEAAEIYELPASTPAIDRDHRGTRCSQPGQKLPPMPVGGYYEEPRRGESTIPVFALGRMSDQPDAPPLRPLKGQAIAGWWQVDEAGAREPLGVRPVGNYDDRPESQRASNIDRIPPNTAGGMGEADVWCGPGMPPTSPVK